MVSVGVEHSGRKEITAVVRLLAQRLFRTHVLDGAHHDAGLSHGLGRGLSPTLPEARSQLGETEIKDLEAALGVDHEVRRLDVAVRDPLSVGGGKGIGKPCTEIDDLSGGQRRPRHPVVDALAVHVLHGDEVDTFSLSDIIDVGYARVVEGRGGTCLILEATPTILALGTCRRQDLERHHPAEPDIAPSRPRRACR